MSYAGYVLQLRCCLRGHAIELLETGMNDVGGGYQSHAVLDHQLGNFLVNIASVLDSPNSSLHRSNDAFLAMGMGSNSSPLYCTLIHNNPKLFVRVRPKAGVFIDAHHAAGGEHLNDGCPTTNLLADSLSALFNTICQRENGLTRPNSLTGIIRTLPRPHRVER